MRDYLVRARAALDGFDAAARALAAAAGTGDTPPILQKSRDTAGALLEATAALRFSLSLPEKTAVDIADLQMRLEDQSRRLARHLKALGEAVEAATARPGSPPTHWLRRCGIWKSTRSAWRRPSFPARSTACARSTRRCGRCG